MTHSLPRILFIGGYGRSGTTLIERVLGQIPGWCAVGEMRHVWERSFRDNQLCGCGQPFHACEFWGAVTGRAFGGVDRLDAVHMVDLARRVDRTRYMPRLLAPGRGGFGRRFTTYADVARRLYGAIATVSGCRVIVDSSKEPSYGWFLRRAGFEVSVLHVVRDSRAVAFSWVRKKERPEVHWRRELMDVHAPLKSAGLWLAFNALCAAMPRLGCAYRRVHYEDFVADPVTALAPVLEMVGESPAALDWVDGRRLRLGPNHTVSGNPMRFAVGDVEVRLDREWRDRMRPADRRLMTALTFPSLLRYGYLGGRRDVGAAPPPAHRPMAALHRDRPR